MKRYKVVPNADGTSDVVAQPGAIRKVWRWYVSAVIYLVAWSLILGGHLVWLIVVLSAVCLALECTARQSITS